MLTCSQIRRLGEETRPLLAPPTYPPGLSTLEASPFCDISSGSIAPPAFSYCIASSSSSRPDYSMECMRVRDQDQARSTEMMIIRLYYNRRSIKLHALALALASASLPPRLTYNSVKYYSVKAQSQRENCVGRCCCPCLVHAQAIASPVLYIHVHTCSRLPIFPLFPGAVKESHGKFCLVLLDHGRPICEASIVYFGSLLCITSRL